MTFADKILKLRKQAGLSQEELAEKLNVSRQAISRWEMGTSVPDAVNLLQMSKLFGITVDYLINDEYQSDRDILIVKQTDVKIKEENTVKNKFVMLVIIQIVAFVLEGLAVILGDFTNTFFLSSDHSLYSKERVIAFVILFSLGIISTLCGIVSFELIFDKFGHNICTAYRKKYYRISVWVFSFFPIICSFFAITNNADMLPLYTALIIGIIIYALVCGIATAFVREKQEDSISKIILRIVSGIMLFVAIIFLSFALTHPEFGTVFYIGSLEIGPSIWRAVYLMYAIVMVGLFVASFFVGEKKKVKT